MTDQGATLAVRVRRTTRWRAIPPEFVNLLAFVCRHQRSVETALAHRERTRIRQRFDQLQRRVNSTCDQDDCR